MCVGGEGSGASALSEGSSRIASSDVSFVAGGLIGLVHCPHCEACLLWLVGWVESCLGGWMFDHCVTFISSFVG